jgi:phytoene dehydrogenase-like protein
MAGFLYAMLDSTRDEKTFKKYDRMTAHEWFRAVGVSKRLVDDFIRPTLLVGLFKPPEELSAAVTMELLYYYALAHQTSFDVRWIKKGTVQSSLINPLAERLMSEGVSVKGGCRATELVLEGGKAVAVRYSERGEDKQLDALDGVVLALGAKGMSGLMKGSPKVARQCPDLAKAASLVVSMLSPLEFGLTDTFQQKLQQMFYHVLTPFEEQVELSSCWINCNQMKRHFGEVSRLRDRSWLATFTMLVPLSTCQTKIS